MTGPLPLLTAPARLRLRILSEADVTRVHEAALELLGAAGPAAEKAALAAPGTFVLAGRVAEHDVVVGARHCWLAAGGAAARVRPRAGGEPRPATAADLDAACRLADALPEVALVYGPPVRAAGLTPLGELAGCLAATTKHIQLVTLRTAAEAEAAVRMALAIAGSATELRRRPLISLCGGAEALGAASVFARAGLPVAVVAAFNMGAGPAGAGGAAAGGGPAAAAAPGSAAPGGSARDLASVLVRHHAGVLAACATIQAAAPGAPFFYLADPVLAGLTAGDPAAEIFQIAAGQLAERLDIPVCAPAMVSGSHEPDWQAGSENAFASLSAMAVRLDILAGAGTLGGGDAFSAQGLVMDSEIFSWTIKIATGIQVDDESIALDTIEKVGIGGNYLGARHTRAHMKDVWRPRLLDRSMWDAWHASGREGAYEKASRLADKLLTEHTVAPLSDEISGVLARIAAEAGL